MFYYCSLCCMCEFVMHVSLSLVININQMKFHIHRWDPRFRRKSRWWVGKTNIAIIYWKVKTLSLNLNYFNPTFLGFTQRLVCLFCQSRINICIPAELYQYHLTQGMMTLNVSSKFILKALVLDSLQLLSIKKKWWRPWLAMMKSYVYVDFSFLLA